MAYIVTIKLFITNFEIILRIPINLMLIINLLAFQ